MWEFLSDKNLQKIARCFRDAIDLDCGNAEAYAGLAHALIAQGMWGLVSKPNVYYAAQAAQKIASQINPDLLESQSAGAWINLLVEHDWHTGRRVFDEILTRHPAFVQAMVGRAMVSVAEGDLSRASSLLLEACSTHALNASAEVLSCWTIYLQGKYSHVIDQIQQFRDSGRQGAAACAIEELASFQLQAPDMNIERMEARIAENTRCDVLRGALGYAYAKSGQSSRAIEMVNEMTDPGSGRMSREPYAVALVLIGLNKNQEALQWLEKSFKDGSMWSFALGSDPILAQLRDDPQCSLPLRKLSYPAADRTNPL
jgi:tetratricopeptide (TPR) repeat protein